MSTNARDALTRRICHASNITPRCYYADNCPEGPCRMADRKDGNPDSGRMADAVLAWLAEPEQIETMTRAITDLNGGVVHPHEAEADIRAAIAALKAKA